MKARILTVILLMITLATFAQSSRRGDSDKNKNNSNNNSANQPERKNNSNQGNSGTTNNGGRQVSRDQNSNSSTPAPATNNNGNSQRQYPSSQNNTPANNNGANTHVSTTNNSPASSGSSNRRESSYERHDNNAPSRGREHDHDDYRDNNHGNDHNRTVIVNNTSRDRNDYRHEEHYRRPVVIVHNHHSDPIEVRRVKYPYRVPVRREIVWSVSMSRDFRIFYPGVSWRYPVGYHILSFSAYDAGSYVGEVGNVYGKVVDTYFNPDADEYYFYFGDIYPYQDFSIVLPGYEARRLSPYPEAFFRNQYISVTGYIDVFENKPEIQVHNYQQISVY